MSCRKLLGAVLQKKQLKHGCNVRPFTNFRFIPHPLLLPHPPFLLTQFTTSTTSTILLYKNTQSQTKFFKLIFLMSGVQLVFWAYLSYFAFAELRQEKLCLQTDQTPPTLQEQQATPTLSTGKAPITAPWYSSLKWRLAISLLALSVGVFFATTACMYPLRVVQKMSYIRGKMGGVSITTYSPLKGVREVRADLSDIGVAGKRVSEAKGRQLGMKYKLKQSQRAKVRHFMAVTGSDDHTAINCLTQNDWRLDMATDNFYQDPLKYFVEPPRAPVDKKKIDILFNKYRNSLEEDKMLADGVSRFCDDVGLDPTSLTVLLIAWKFKAATQCEFSRKEFVDGMSALGCDSIEKLRKKCENSAMEKELKEPPKFKDFYQFTFNFAKNPGQKGLDLDMALAYWNIAMKGRFKFLDLWCQFLQVSYDYVNA
ncbi:DCN1-like protein 1 [Geodia barretti]|uniref:Defective in cullin neddylation protein n=1 Tax=Geodia barretti TaxID=519541 RepID=A0AA35QZ93_GEOBA|nr:DCN1-like protein 1 [Geodia barretti]